MALVDYAQGTAATPVDDLERLRHQYKEAFNRRAELRLALVQRLRQEIAQSDRECEEIAQQLNMLNRDRPDVPAGY